MVCIDANRNRTTFVNGSVAEVRICADDECTRAKSIKVGESLQQTGQGFPSSNRTCGEFGALANGPNNTLSLGGQTIYVNLIEGVDGYHEDKCLYATSPAGPGVPYPTDYEIVVISVKAFNK